MKKSFARLPFKRQLIFITAIASCLIAVNLSTVLAATVSQAYHGSSSLVLGTVVSTETNGKDLGKTSLDNESRLVGVVIGSNDSVIDVQPGGSDIRVGYSGQVSVLVSDISGNIKS